MGRKRSSREKVLRTLALSLCVTLGLPGFMLWFWVLSGVLTVVMFCVCSLKASKEAGQALVCKTNPNFEMHHHHLLHCLEKTTVGT